MKKRAAILSIFLLASISLFIALNFVSAVKIEDWFKGIIGFSPPEEGLIAHFEFEVDHKDSVGTNTGNNLGATFTTGKIGNAASFDGINDYIAFSDILNQLSSFSISSWIKPEAISSEHNIVRKGLSGAGNPPEAGYGLVILYDNLFAKIDDGTKSATLTANIQSLKDTFFHTTLTIDRSANTMKLFINGVEVNSTSIQEVGSVYSNLFFAIGALDRNPGSPLVSGYFKGLIDDLRIYNRALSSAEIAELYQLGIKPANLLCTNFGYEEGVVGACCDIECTKYDLSQCKIITKSCIDNDKGIIYFTASNVSTSISTLFGPTCSGIPPQAGAGSGTIFSDRCESDVLLKEYFCQPNNEEGFVRFECPNGCGEGACLPAPGEPICGDKIVQEGEECDDGNDNDNDDCTNLCKIKVRTEECTDSDEIETKEINVGEIKNVAGLNILVEEAEETNLRLSVKLRVSPVNPTDYGLVGVAIAAAGSIDVSLDDKNPKKEVKFGDVKYIIELVSASDTAATIKVTNGFNVFTKGTASNSTKSETDLCLVQDGAFKTIIENYCENGAVVSESYECPNGCGKQDDGLYGACKRPLNPRECKALLDLLATKQEIYEGYILKDVETDEEESSDWGGRAKETLYDFENKEKNKGITIATVVLEEGVLTEETPWFDSLDEYDLIGGDIIYTNDKNNRVYILTEPHGEAIIMLWVNKNVVVFMVIYDLNSERTDVKNIEELIRSLQDNKFESLIDYSNPNYRILSRIAYELIASCPSTINELECIPRWERKVEPVVCPPHGYQNIITRDINGCNKEVIQNSQSCSPGICSGCYVPRWIGYDGRGDNICIPYTTRLANEESEEERIYVDGDEPEVNLTCLDESRAELKLYDISGPDGTEGREELISLILNEGETYTLQEELFGEEIRFRVDNLECGENRRQYVDVSVIESFDAYCDIDGQIKRQRIKDARGNWAKCQNNYECDSNLCSGGECVEINDAIKQAKGFKSIFVRVICRIAHIFSEDNYNRCVGEYLGYSSKE